MTPSIVQGFNNIPKGHTYCIANFCFNHNGDEETATEMLQLVKSLHYDAVKIPLVQAKAYYTKEELDRTIPKYPSMGKTFGEMLEKIQLDKTTLTKLKTLCTGKIDFIGAPRDTESLTVFEEIDVDSYAVEPTSITDIPLLQALSATGNTIFLSVGACTEKELKRALEIFTDNEVILLHCVAATPLKADDAHLNFLKYLQKYNKPIGFNDYENGIALSPIAVALGARVIERKFTLDRTQEGPEHLTSLEIIGMRKVIRDIRKAEKAHHQADKGRPIFHSEMPLFEQDVKTIAATRAIKKGETIKKDMLTLKAPHRGLLPSMLPELIGKEVIEDIVADEHITFSKVRL